MKSLLLFLWVWAFISLDLFKKPHSLACLNLCKAISFKAKFLLRQGTYLRFHFPSRSLNRSKQRATNVPVRRPVEVLTITVPIHQWEGSCSAQRGPGWAEPSPPAPRRAMYGGMDENHGRTMGVPWKHPWPSVGYAYHLRGGSDGQESDCNGVDAGSIPGSGRSPGKGNDNPLQYSCLENLMDRGAWQDTVHGVTKSHIRLSD